MSSRPRFEQELDDELAHHLNLQTEQFIEQGMSPDDARREARRQFGSMDRVREEVRETRGLSWLTDLARDVRIGCRMLLRNPGFTITVVIVLGLALCLTTTIFSFVKAILVEPLPYPDADRLVLIHSYNPERELQLNGVSWPDLLDWQEQAESFTGIAAFRPLDIDLTNGTSTRRLQGMSATRNFFDVVGVPLAIGRTFTEDETRQPDGVLVLSHGVWQRDFDGDPSQAGKSQDVYSWARFPETGPFSWEIVGATAFDVPFPPTVTDVGGRAPGFNDRIEFWQSPWVYDHDDRRARYEFTTIARLKPGVTVEQADAEMRIISDRLAESYPVSNQGWTTRVVPLEEAVTSRVRSPLLLLCGASGLVLLIACANVAGLLIVRGLARQQEFAVRTALGAGHGRLVRQLVTESGLLGLAGGLVGVLLAVWCVDAVRLLAPPDIPRLQTVRVDAVVPLFATALALLTGVAVGILPAIVGAATASNLSEHLKAGGRGSSATRLHRRLMGGLVVSEVAISLVLLAGTGLLIRSFLAAISVDPGFRSDELLTMTVSLPQAKYEWKHNSEFCVELTSKLRELPGVENASAVRGVPTRETHFDCQLYFQGQPSVPIDQLPQGKIRVIEPEFFATMGVPLLEGRLF